MKPSVLENLGNTCFMNSLLQCLTYTPKLTDFLKSNLIKDESCHSFLTQEWIDLQSLLYNNENARISPKRFLKVVQYVANKSDKHNFTGYLQNDIYEFLLFVFCSFQHSTIQDTVEHTILSNTKLAKRCKQMIVQTYEKSYSKIIGLFYGVQVYQMYRINNEFITNNVESFFTLNLSIPVKKQPTLYDCLDTYTQKEHLKGNNMWYNEESKEKEEVIRQVMFFSLPEILIIVLKRFNNNLKKNATLVHIPVNDLNMKDYMIETIPKDSYNYELFGVCNHSGTLMGGHYTAFIKRDYKWFHMNDSICTNIENIEHTLSNKAYCLFYRKK